MYLFLFFSAKASLGCRRQPRRVRSCIESAPMTDPPSYEDNNNSTPPFKFRQDQSGEVRSRLVELSVERTNRSFLSVWQRSTSWRYSLCMAKGEKKCCEIFLWTCLQEIWKTLFHVPHAITSKKTVTWDVTTNCFQKACLLRCVKTRGKNYWNKRKYLTRLLIVSLRQTRYVERRWSLIL